MALIDLDRTVRIGRPPVAPHRYRTAHTLTFILAFGLLAFLIAVPGNPMVLTSGAISAAHTPLVKVLADGSAGEVVLITVKANGLTERSVVYGDTELDADTVPIVSVVLAVAPSPDQRAVCAIEVDGEPQDVAFTEVGTGIAVCRWSAD